MTISDGLKPILSWRWCRLLYAWLLSARDSLGGVQSECSSTRLALNAISQGRATSWIWTVASLADFGVTAYCMVAVAIQRQLTGHIAVSSRGLVYILNDDLYNATFFCLVPLASGDRPPGQSATGMVWCQRVVPYAQRVVESSGSAH